jgi:hypothetical protein
MAYRKQLVEEAIALCPSALIRRGEIGGVLGGHVQYFIHTPLREVRLRYDLPDRTEQYYTLPLQTTSCHYGGERWWIRCSRCYSRRRTLYLASGHPRFACRGCLRLGYRTQLMRPLPRAQLALRRLEARYPSIRPWGMWRQTLLRGLMARGAAETKLYRLSRLDVADRSWQVGLLSEIGTEAGWRAAFSARRN